MEKMNNLLDMNNDILNIIGDYVKKDNLGREIDEIIQKETQIQKEKFKVRLFNFIDNEMKQVIKNSKTKMSRKDTRIRIYNAFLHSQVEFKNYFLSNDDINEFYEAYLILKKLNLKKK